MCEDENMETERYIWWRVKLAVDTVLSNTSVYQAWNIIVINANIYIAMKIDYF